MLVLPPHPAPPPKFVLDTLESFCAKFGAFFQSLTIFPSNQSTWRHVKIPAHPHDFAAPLPKFLLPLTIPPATQAVKKCVKIDPTSFPGFSPLWRSKSDNPGNEVESTMNLSRGRGGGVLPYMGYIGMCRCEGYGFQTDIQSNLSLRTPLLYWHLSITDSSFGPPEIFAQNHTFFTSVYNTDTWFWGLTTLNISNRILQCWWYHVKINFARYQHNSERTQIRAELEP